MNRQVETMLDRSPHPLPRTVAIFALAIMAITTQSVLYWHCARTGDWLILWQLSRKICGTGGMAKRSLTRNTSSSGLNEITSIMHECADNARGPTGPRRSFIYYGYVVGALSLIPGYLGFSYLDSGLDAWSRGWGYRGLLISLPLLALAFGLAYGSAP